MGKQKVMCGKGKHQSPIDIKTSNAKPCSLNCNLTFYYRSSSCFIKNMDKDIILDYDAGSHVIYDNNVYELDVVGFTLPSSHKINGKNYTAEMQLYHTSPDIGKKIIVSIMIDINDAYSKSKTFFEMLSNNLPKYSGEEKYYNTSDEWNIFNAIPESKSFYTYNGSLMRHPCSEDVTWVVFDTPVNMGDRTFYNLKKVMGYNSKTVQKLNGRTVYYNSNSGSKSVRNMGNRLRCYTDKELRDACNCMAKKPINITMHRAIKTSLFIIIATVLSIVLFIGLVIGKKRFGDIMAYLNNLKPFSN